MSGFHFQAVLFDMDGTLIDTEPYWLAAEVELMSRYGVEWTERDQQICLGGPLDRVGDYMSDLAGGVESGSYFEKTLVGLVSDSFQTGINFMPGALELLREIANTNVPLALVSASPRILVDAALKALEERGENYFSLSVSSTEVSKSKPDPEGYLKAAQALGVDIKEALILEDSATGITAAKSSGAYVLAIPHIVELDLNEKCIKVDSLDGVTYPSLLQDFSQLPAALQGAS